MSDFQPMISYQEIVGALRELLESESTGTFFFATEENHVATFRLNKGEVVELRYQRFKGADALNALLSVKHGRYRFLAQTSAKPQDAGDLPATTELLRILETQRAMGSAATVAPVGGSASPSSGDQVALTPRMRAIIEEEATEYLGPMASLVCDEVFDEDGAQGQADLNHVLDHIASEIQDAEREAQFKQRALARLES